MNAAFNAWKNKINLMDKFVIEENGDMSINIKEKNEASMGSFRIECSQFLYPRFINRATRTTYTYNAALLEVLNQAIRNSTYLNELQVQLKKITRHRVFHLASNANMLARNNNTYVIVNGDFDPDFDINKEETRNYASQFTLQPTSEKGIGDGRLVISTDSIYKSIGYNFDNGNFTSLFPNKSNLAARLKSFLLPDSVRLTSPEDNVFIDGDANTAECLTLFVRPGKERHVSGEVWANSRFCKKTFKAIKHVWYVDTNLKEGDECKPSDAKIMSSFGSNNSLSNASWIRVLEKNAVYMKIEALYNLAEARITSQSGLKGYSVIYDDIGKLVVFGEDGLPVKELIPDMVVGPSSVKGKVNQIRLAQAAFVAKGLYGYGHGTLNSLDEKLINDLAEECPLGIWVDPEGVEHECLFGLTNVAFTDPSVQYSRNKKINFQFEMTKLAKIEYPDLYDLILGARDTDEMQIVREMVLLEESLKGNVINGFVAKSIDLFSGTKAKEPIDRISSVEAMPVGNPLINADREPFILVTKTGERIYIPSGKTLRSFQSAGTNGQWLYDITLVQLSRIFNRVRSLDGLKKAVENYILTIGNKAVLYPSLLGLNMKMVTLYDYTMTVSIPTSNLMDARKKIYGDEDGWETKDIYAIASRNPA